MRICSGRARRTDAKMPQPIEAYPRDNGWLNAPFQIPRGRAARTRTASAGAFGSAISEPGSHRRLAESGLADKARSRRITIVATAEPRRGRRLRPEPESRWPDPAQVRAWPAGRERAGTRHLRSIEQFEPTPSHHPRDAASGAAKSDKGAQIGGELQTQSKRSSKKIDKLDLSASENG
jgi:hypothetical protein